MAKHFRSALVISITVVLTVGCDAVPSPATPPLKASPVVGSDVPPTMVIAPTVELRPVADTNIQRAWANSGGDKVTRDELRAWDDPNRVINRVWDGTHIQLFGARNETVEFNLVLESPQNEASDVEVRISSLIGANGGIIRAGEARRDNLFDFVGRDIELFYVRYLQIRGLSTRIFFLGYDYDERTIPYRCRRPYDSDGIGSGLWTDRPCHDLFYPDIAVPLELEQHFTIPAGMNQSIWGDITIPDSTPPDIYVGMIEVSENGIVTWRIPIELQVRDFSLPDLPGARTMVYVSSSNLSDRYFGVDCSRLSPDTSPCDQLPVLLDHHFMLAHRHRISLVTDNVPLDQMDEAWTARLNGDLFTPERGYAGPGVGVGNNVFAIGMYGTWSWQTGNRADMWANTDAWVEWFDAQALATPIDYFLYLIDESFDYKQLERWAAWINQNPGPGQRLMSMATINVVTAARNTPSLDIPTTWPAPGSPEWQEAVNVFVDADDKQFYMYNSSRPMTGSFAIEDDGVALRALAWSQYKMGIDRWFYWESTYYDNFQGQMGRTDVFLQAQTFGSFERNDNLFGETGRNYLNGDGVLFYPGTEMQFPEASYGVSGPLASLRLKYWRRGIQDVDYLTMAATVNPVSTEQIVEALIPRVLWEVASTDSADHVAGDISWPTDPDAWEEGRAELADIIESAVSDW